MPDLSLPRGVLTPMITPFRNGAFDKGQLAILIERQIMAGIHGLIFCDQMGEGWSLSLREQQDLFGAAGEAVKERIPIIATVGTYCTAQTIDRIKTLPQSVSALMVTIPSRQPKGSSITSRRSLKARHCRSLSTMILVAACGR